MKRTCLNNNNNAVNLPATFTVKLVDAPVAYDKVFIDIQDIMKDKFGK